MDQNNNPTTLINSIMDKSVQFAEQTIENSKPGFMNILKAIEKWLSDRLK